jgi:hypothetical protein
MAAPRKTAGLVNFTGQLDDAFPQRRKPDGWIADDNHTGVSDHHPDDTPGSKPGWDGDPDKIPDVRAADVSANLGPGVRMRDVCDHLARLPGLGKVIRYFIHDGWIWHVRNGFEPVRHTGDPHPTHLHVTFAWTEAADDNTTFDYRFEEIPVALTDADKKWLKAEIDAAATKAAERTWATRITDYADDDEPRRQLTAATWIGYSDHRHRTTEARVIEAVKAADQPA